MIDPGEDGPISPHFVNVKNVIAQNVTNDRSDDHDWVHQDIWEVNLMNTTEEMNDDRTWCR